MDTTLNTEMDAVLNWLAERQSAWDGSRPLVTMSYAQSLDGSLAARRGQPLALSGPASMRLTHALRAAHPAILVGVGTVLADNPRLTVRHVSGEHPQPVIVDSLLRIPLHAALLTSPARPPWIAVTNLADAGRCAALEAAGARLLRFPPAPDGRVPLDALLARLAEEGIGSLMVEGGARIITSLLSLCLVDLAIITLAPLLVGGLQAVEGPLDSPFPRLTKPNCIQLDEDFVIYGEL